MCILNRHALSGSRLAIICAIAFCTSGCMSPYGNRGMYGYGTPYMQPSYGQPAYGQPMMNGAPGSLIIPESSMDPYVPGSTYDNEPPSDDFQKSPDGDFYGSDKVPDPRDLPSQQFNSDLGRSSTFYQPETQAFPADGGIELASATRTDSAIQQVSGRLDHGEYGFDTNDYRWLRGVLRYDAATSDWSVTYSLAARDRYAGRLTLAVSAQQISGLSEGDNIDVVGHVDENARDQSGRAVYHVHSISRID